MTPERYWRTSRMLMLLGTVIVLASNMRPWARVLVTEEMSPQLALNFSGRQIDVMPSAFVIVVIASIFIIGFLRGLSLRLVQLIVALSSLGIVWFSLNGHDMSAKISELVANQVGREIESMTVNTYPWWMGSVAGAILILVASGFGLLASPPQRQNRYERGESEHDLTPWQALDAGLDPTQQQSTN